VAVSAMQNPTRHSIVPQKSSETSADFTISVASTEPEPETTDPSTTASTIPDTTAATTLAPDTTPSSEVVDTSMPDEVAGDGSGVPGGGGSSGRGGPTSATPTLPAGTQTFNSAGGSIIVHNDGDKLTLVAATPAAGFRA